MITPIFLKATDQYYRAKNRFSEGYRGNENEEGREPINAESNSKREDRKLWMQERCRVVCAVTRDVFLIFFVLNLVNIAVGNISPGKINICCIPKVLQS